VLLKALPERSLGINSIFFWYKHKLWVDAQSINSNGIQIDYKSSWSGEEGRGWQIGTMTADRLLEGGGWVMANCPLASNPPHPFTSICRETTNSIGLFPFREGKRANEGRVEASF
jgi:hypothetical protein